MLIWSKNVMKIGSVDNSSYKPREVGSGGNCQHTLALGIFFVAQTVYAAPTSQLNKTLWSN